MEQFQRILPSSYYFNFIKSPPTYTLTESYQCGYKTDSNYNQYIILSHYCIANFYYYVFLFKLNFLNIMIKNYKT